MYCLIKKKKHRLRITLFYIFFILFNHYIPYLYTLQSYSKPVLFFKLALFAFFFESVIAKNSQEA